MPMKTTLGALALVLATAMAPAPPALAQNPFEAVTTVNGAAITRFQVEQRARFLGLLGAPDASFEAARAALVDETLQIQAARRAGIGVTPAELDAGMVEFAARGGLSPERFLAVLEQAGIAPEAFRDFVRNGLLWRGYVQRRFGAAARPAESEVVRTLEAGDPAERTTVLLSEIAIPYGPENKAEVLALARQLSDGLRGQEAFQRAARQYSRSPSAARGGRLDPLPLGRLAPPIAAQVLALAPGEVSEPLDLGSFVGLFLLRGLDAGAAPTAAEPVEIAVVTVPGPRAEALGRAARVRQDSDRCDDLYGTAGGLSLARETTTPGALPADVRQAVATLDAGEAAILGGADAVRLVMLCRRGAAAAVDEDALERIGRTILSRRLGTLADAALADLHVRADIR
ncbi:peptidylprolyl isomerase [Jannaschia sp. W003]|uniref:peptidylprolyl isomerase n=1 Tax=Jannaschia sp. W003 TaxID=2867012 RepID=UPI0021A684E8|nr:peptidylprolyl isomerase [Jannaschia sp. W003]